MVAAIVALAVVAAVVVALGVTAVVAPVVAIVVALVVTFVVALAVAAVVDLAVAVVDIEVKDGVEVVLAIPEEAVPEVGCVGAPRGGFSMGPIESSGNCNSGPLGITLTAVGQVPWSAL